MKAEDLAQKFELDEWERRQKDAIQPRPTVESAEYCADAYCGAPIPKMRQALLPGVQFCAECQERNERMIKLKGRYASAD